MKNKILEIIDKELLEFGCTKEDIERRDLDSFQEPIVSIIRLRQKIIRGIRKWLKYKK